MDTMHILLKLVHQGKFPRLSRFVKPLVGNHQEDTDLFEPLDTGLIVQSEFFTKHFSISAVDSIPIVHPLMDMANASNRIWLESRRFSQQNLPLPLISHY